MFCPQCGANNSDGAAFCSRCGAALKSAGGQTAAPAAQGGPTMSPVTVAYAGFWKRFAAIIIDAIIVDVATGILLLVSLGAFAPVLFFAGWLYYSLMESSSRQATLGKMALGIVVTDNAGKRISFGRATGRYFAKIISAIILFVGFIMIAFTEKKQGLHDMLASTLVVLK